IALTHSPATEDSNGVITGEAAEIAANANDIDAVIAAHNHKFVDGFVTNINNGKEIPVVQAGYNGRGLSVLTFTVDDNNEIISIDANTRQFYVESTVNDFPIDKNVDEAISKFNDELAPTLATEIVDLEFDLDHDRYAGVTPLGITVAEAMRQAGGTQVAIANGGGIRAPLSKGMLTLGDMYTILPFDNNVVTMKVTGAKLKELIQHGINPDGFGWGQYSGLTVWYDSKTDEITSMRLSDGTKVEDDEYYTLTSIDFLMTGGDSYNFDGHIDPVIIGEMRDVIINEWQTKGIEKLNYNLLIDGEDTTDIVADEKVEVKPEITPEQVPSETPDSNENVESDKGTGSVEKLPQTGTPLSSAQVIFISLAIIAVGFVIFNKKEEIA
ncbi:MAG: 5'-nucleotidase C-terminal domain-containing protein, partial [Clostridium saudiense]|nr:5'-nucleotidase C-terminal domain-containing protein [Clostridium saudiense]